MADEAGGFLGGYEDMSYLSDGSSNVSDVIDNPFLGTYEDIAAADAAGSFDFSGLLDSAGKINWAKLLTGAGGVAAGITGLTGGGGSSQKPTGYQGKVPTYQAVRQQVPMLDQDPARRPGSGGRQYFTNTQYIPSADQAGIAAAQTGAQQQSNQIAQANTAPTQGQRTALLNAAQATYPAKSPIGAAHGGLMGLARGGSTGQPRFLAGGTDGMADKIPATIEGKQPAKLGHGEFVVPADVVGFLGSGNSEAGAKVLYAMMDRVRKNAHGNKKQIKPANLKKTLPA